MFGVEADTILEPCTSGKYGKCFARPLQFTQWTLVSTSKHQLITEIVEEVSKALLVYDGHFPTVWEILDLTGPGIWSDVIIKNLISRTGKKLEDFSGIKDDITVGEDLRMLTITGFSSGRSPPLMGAHPRDHPLAYVAHKFMGSWKNEQYKCKKTSVIPPLDGRLEGAWDTAPWSTDFSDKTTHEVLKPRFKTNFKMLYDNNHLYIAAKIEDPHIWANLEVDNYERKLSQYVELYINPRRNGKNFYKFEINPVNEIKESKQGGTESPIKISGLQHKVHINGTLNSPQDIDKYWSFTIAIPWDGLSDLVDNKVTHTPPNVNELWMIDFSRELDMEWFKTSTLGISGI
ncbi:hypothetical protein HK099_006125 [Clydaea vesicula]|uniref:Carbohydrate-binding domain-containing protein n=1 Tax=Clydaea vesicula TaxID=447962 RepID=A0AAD5U7H8_9FUNG|nr:hypothetical protein HK099_006125 [Clydaea vesicula]